LTSSAYHYLTDKSQRTNQFVKHLPNFDRINQNATNELDQIKRNLARSIVLNELRPGIMHWVMYSN
jgi:hypothetical protein